MAAKCVVLFFVCLINGVYMGEPSQKIQDTLLSPWYCQRLVPALITAAVTPCTYPCLFLSPHEHPRIIVQPERDGTPCRITTDLDHRFEVGKCGDSVCRTRSHHTKLKRKKRFICLYTLVKWLLAKKKLDELKKIIAKLEQDAEARRNNAIQSVVGGAAGTGGIASSGSPGAAASSANNRGSYLDITGSTGRIGVSDIGRRSRGSLDIENNGNLGANFPSTVMIEGLGSGTTGTSTPGIGNGIGGVFGRPGEDRTAIRPGTSRPNDLIIGGVGTGPTGLGNTGEGISAGLGIGAGNRNALGSSTVGNNNIGIFGGLSSSSAGAGVLSTSNSNSAGRATSINNISGGSRAHPIVNVASESSAVSVVSSGGNTPTGTSSISNGRPIAGISVVRS